MQGNALNCEYILYIGTIKYSHIMYTSKVHSRVKLSNNGQNQRANKRHSNDEKSRNPAETKANKRPELKWLTDNPQIQLASG